MTTLVLDTSALLAVLLGEPTGPRVAQQLDAADNLLMSTVNLTECLLILRQHSPDSIDTLQDRLLSSRIAFIAPDANQATLAALARHTYPLNLGDCFAYALAKSVGQPLLTLDQDFRHTDLSLLKP